MVVEVGRWLQNVCLSITDSGQCRGRGGGWGGVGGGKEAAAHAWRVAPGWGTKGAWLRNLRDLRDSVSAGPRLPHLGSHSPTSWRPSRDRPGVEEAGMPGTSAFSLCWRGNCRSE